MTDRFTGWQMSAGLAALTVIGVLVVAVSTGPVPVVLGTALTVCGFAGAQAVLVNLAPDLVAADDRNTAQGLLNFMNVLGGGIGPAAVAGLSGIVPAPVALAVLAALPLAGLVISLTRRPAAAAAPHPVPRVGARTDGPPAPDPTTPPQVRSPAMSAEPFEVSITEAEIADLRERLRRTPVARTRAGGRLVTGAAAGVRAGAAAAAGPRTTISGSPSG
ncbi:hypothetical protein TPA0909_00260 [Streptomyces albus]|nr:hypothetical protein TPA0909_00260 [Streptomyces albus]